MGYTLNLCKFHIYNVPYNHDIVEEGMKMTQNRIRIVDVADALGLSTATVSNVIHGKTEKERMCFYEDNYMQLLENSVTAVFAVSDFYALEFMRFLQRKNIRIPEDIQIIGFDDNMASRESNPSLTTIHQEANLRAKAAIECLEAMRDGAEYKTEIVLPVDLIKRESTRKL